MQFGISRLKNHSISRGLRHPLILLAAALTTVLVGCSMLPFGQPQATQPPDHTATPPIIPIAQPTSLPVEDNLSDSTTLVIWMPPEFDPAAGTSAGDLLSARLDSFLETHANVQIEVRIKALEGTGGLLDSLSTTSAAAPLALPDLVALPRSLVEEAALKGLLRPLDDLTQIQSADDWYPYASELAHLQNRTFGLPFAGDALLMASTPGAEQEGRFSWNETIVISGTLAFPASDSEALFPLSLYLAAGGTLLDEQGRPALNPAELTTVLEFLALAEQAGNLPYWNLQHDSLDQSWEVFTQGQVDQTLCWSSRYLALPADQASSIQVALLPAPERASFTLISGWLWALPANRPARQSLSVQLAEYLVDSTFLIEWAAAAGYVPTRSSAIAEWPLPETLALVEQIAAVAHPYPPEDILLVIGPVLKQAALDVLIGQLPPQQAAEKAVSDLSGE